MEKITFATPAKKWEQALPIGNGRLGAMIYGGIQKECLDLNQDSIWYGGPMERNNPDAREHLEEVRGLLLAGKIPEAEEILRYSFSGTPQSERPYQPLGTLEITYQSSGCDLQPEQYVRELDLEQALVTEHYQIREQKIRKEYFASCPHGVLAIHIQAEQGTISLDCLLGRKRFYDHAGKLDDTTIYMDGCLGTDGVAWMAAVTAVTEDGSVSVRGEHLIVRESSELTLYLACETSFYQNDWTRTLKERLCQAKKAGYKDIRKQHIKDYRGLYARVALNLPEDEFAVRYFQYGRYLLISSSRPGSLPANLQGIWNDSMEPSWDSKYTININTEMNYWPAELCGLSECHLPLFEHLLKMWPKGKETARRMYGCRGFVAHHNTDIWGDCAPQDIYIPATYWVMGAAWLSTHIWTHYSYTRDKDFLERLYPVLEDAVLFFHDYLIEVDGMLMTCPSVSPENTYILPDGVQGCMGAGSTMDNEILRDLMEGYLKASEELGRQGEEVEKTREIIKRLPPLRIGKHGQIMEWREDYEEMEPGHRHISQLYALHPSHQITVDRTPRLAEAARSTLERRLSYGGGHTGWSCAWIVNFYARLGDGEKAYENLKKLWSNSTFPNLMDTHPRGDGYVFQIDGNLGATAAIAEMLVQSDEERVILLPALPLKWRSGSVKGLTLPDRTALDLEWMEGELTSCTIHVEQDRELTVSYRGEEKTYCLKPGENVI